jgi:uncharacterized membrane protein YhhN
MAPVVLILLVIVLIAGILAIVLGYAGRWKLVYVFKPLAMAGIIALALLARQPYPRYQAWVLAGLGFSFLGDVFLMLRRKRFLPGLASFFAAHVCYIGAFLSTMSSHLSFGTLLPFFIYALFMMQRLAPYLGKMKAPVVLYIVAITIMAALAAERYVGAGGTKRLFAFVGALLFVVSDSVLAADRFMKKFPAAQAVILSTYFVAQTLIALSV